MGKFPNQLTILNKKHDRAMIKNLDSEISLGSNPSFATE